MIKLLLKIMSDNFLSKGMIVITEGIGGKHRDEKSATADGTLQNYPLVVLVNSGSASASEIVAGAIKNNERGLVIGAQTFGKGSVQMLYDFSDESALKLTVAEYLTPGDQSIQSVGITPDVQLEPIRIKKDDIHIGAEKMLPRETYLKNYLSTSKLKKSQALESLVFLEKNHKTDEEKVVDEKIREDFPIKLAEKIIKCSAQADRMAQLKSCKSVFEQTKMEQEKKIVQAFKKVGIDWSKGVSSQKVSAQVSYKIVDPTPPPITAGEEIKIKVTVKNTGKGTFFRLYGVTNSEYYIFRGKEFVFGKLSPGQEKTREISVKIPQDAMQRTDPVKLSFHELNKNTPEKVKFNVPIQALGRPSISFNYLMDDCCSGNCNGKIDKGERIGLVFVIKSNGGGEFQELVSSIKNLEGKSVYIEKGRVKLDKLKPGAFAVARFTVKVKKDYIKDNLKMRFFITDNKLLEQYMQTINLKVNKSSNSATKSKGKCLKGKKLAISQMDMPWQSPQISIAHLLKNQPNSTLSIPISGLVKNRLAIKDVMIFANEKKVFYQKGSNSPKNGGKNFQLPFSATIPLEEGKNFINIIARQTDDLAMRRSLVVYREKVE